MSTVIKFLGMALSMANTKNEKGEEIGKANIKAIEEAHSMNPFASVTACYEGIGAIIALKGLDPKNTNKEACSSRDNEVKAMKRGYTSYIANSKKDQKDQIKKLYTWQEWKDKAGFTEEENAIIAAACNGEPSYMYIYENKNFIAYKISKEDHKGAEGEYSAYIRESPFKSYNDIMLGLKKVYSNSKQDGECRTTYKMKDSESYTFYYKDFIDSLGVYNLNEPSAIKSEVKKFEEFLIQSIKSESQRRIAINEKIEEEKKNKEEVKKAREGARNKVNNMTLEDLKAFEEFLKIRQQNK